jgi:2-oxoglutarate ferredoxin oxidoreductase subunit delta
LARDDVSFSAFFVEISAPDGVDHNNRKPLHLESANRLRAETLIGDHPSILLARPPVSFVSPRATPHNALEESHPFLGGHQARGVEAPRRKDLKLTGEFCMLRHYLTSEAGARMAGKRQGETPKKKRRQAGAAAASAAGSEPAPKSEAREAKFDLEIYRAWCKGCGICVAFCPAEVLAMNEQGEPEVVKPELCTGCTWCELRCPDFAITVRRKEKKHEEACEPRGENAGLGA